MAQFMDGNVVTVEMLVKTGVWLPSKAHGSGHRHQTPPRPGFSAWKSACQIDSRANDIQCQDFSKGLQQPLRVRVYFIDGP